MKKLAIIFVAFMFSVAFTQAQELNELKGPAAKNYKPWDHQQKSSVLILNESPKENKGPEFKNGKIWEEDLELGVIDIGTESKERKTGPAVKNRKPWKKN